MLSGISANLPGDTILDSGVVFVGTDSIGVTVGGAKFDPQKTTQNATFDGKRGDVAELDRITGWDPVISFAMIELGGDDTGAQIALVEPGSSEAQTGHPSINKGVWTTTPRAANDYFAAGDYLADLRIVFQRGQGGYAAIYFPVALCTKWDIQGQDKNEARISAEFHARLSITDGTDNPAKCPYQIEIRDALPS